MLLEISLEEILVTLEKPRTIHKQTIVPNKTPAVSHSPYRVGYDWLFFYERKLFRILEPWLAPYRFELIGSRGILSELLSNAYCHGHKRDASLPIRVSVRTGTHGLIVGIEDVGPGFGQQKIMENFRKGKNYYHLAGNGFRLSAESKNFGVFYNRKGNIAYLLYMFDSQPEVTFGP